MYTQEIVCPHCGKMTIVNVADAKAKTITPCQRYWCKSGIVVETDENGKVVSISKKGCFLTTACVQAAGLHEDSYELETLRKFRDNYVCKLPNGMEVLSTYYAESTKIVDAISQSQSPNAEYQHMLNIINRAIFHIESGENEKAFSVYMGLFTDLSVKYLR